MCGAFPIVGAGTACNRCVNVHTPGDLHRSLGRLNFNSENHMGVLRKAADAAAPASQWLEEEREALGARGARLVDSTCKYVAAHPLQSLGMALVAGYLIGRIAR
jgi:ElaB/YqjD/DUF883 family membrane-anchored ribosome-binding protein